MQNSKALMKKAGIVPPLKLATRSPKGGTISTGPHTVKLIEDRIVKGVDFQTKAETEFVAYIVEENGEKKQYKTRLKSRETGELSYLVQHLAEIPEGSEVTLEFKRKGPRGYIEVSYAGEIETAEEEQEISEEPTEEDLDAEFEKA